MAIYHGDIVEKSGFKFRVTWERDDDGGKPWENSDGHGPVRESNYSHRSQRAGKAPGERPLNDPGRDQTQYFYDWAGACKLARRDGWNAAPYDAPGRVLRAVQSDFDFLSGWLNDQWEYLVVQVDRINAAGDVVETEYLGGVESFKDYHKTAALEIIDGMLSTWKSDFVKRMREGRERAYWAARDVVTA